jgi:hypothetical protein
MDNYTLSIPLLFSILFGYIHHFNHLYVSNTKMIMRQGDQIQFLLTRIMELENKIKKLNSDITIDIDTISEDDNLVEEEEDEDLFGEEDIIEDQKVDKDDIVEDNNQLIENEKEFELIEPNSTFKITKNNGWLRFIF